MYNFVDKWDQFGYENDIRFKKALKSCGEDNDTCLAGGEDENYQACFDRCLEFFSKRYNLSKEDKRMIHSIVLPL